LTHDFDSVINAFNRVESLGEALGNCAVKHKVSIQLAACFEIFLFYFKSQMLWELSKE